MTKKIIPKEEIQNYVGQVIAWSYKKLSAAAYDFPSARTESDYITINNYVKIISVSENSLISLIRIDHGQYSLEESVVIADYVSLFVLNEQESQNIRTRLQESKEECLKKIELLNLILSE